MENNENETKLTPLQRAKKNIMKKLRMILIIELI